MILKDHFLCRFFGSYLSLGPGREVRGCGELIGWADWDQWEACSGLEDSGLAAMELRDEF